VTRAEPVGRQHRPQSISLGALVVTAAAGLFVASGYVVNVWLGRLLGPEDYGRFGVVITLLTLLNVVQNAAIPQAVARTAAQSPENGDATLRRGAELQLTSAVLMAAALAVGAPLIASAFGDPRLSGPLVIASLVLPSYGLFTLLMAFHNGRRHYTRQALTQSAYAVAKAIAAIGLAYAFRLGGALAGYVIAPIIGIVAGWHWPSRSRWSVPYRHLIGFAGPLSIYAIASVGQMSVDIFFVKAMLPDPEAAGHYAAAQNVGRVPYYLLTGLAAIILPAIAAASQRGREEAARTAGQAVRWGLIVVLPIAALIVATRAGLVELLYSSEYRPAAEILAFLGPAMAALAVSSIAAGVLSGLGRPTVPAAFAIIGLVVSIAGCLIMIPAAGAVGAALATLVGCLATLAGLLAALWRSAPGSVPIISIVRIATVSIVVALAGWLVDAEGGVLIATYVGLGLLAAIAMLVSGELTVDEVRMLVGRLRGRPVGG
jgi:stage V sporulation protein B